MSDSKQNRPKARLPRGFRDRAAAEIAAERAVLDTVRRVYESYGFSPLETPAFEYTDALGKFLPDLDRPNEGVFSLQDDDGQWLSLRYDLTAPLARYVAANFQHLTKPFRRYQLGPVWRNEKPGPGRFREFLQFDADTVGSGSPSADAELLMMLSDALEALGLKRGDYIIKLNNRKLLDEVIKAAAIDPSQRGTVLRAMDKFDRLGEGGVRALLGEGRKDEFGDFTKGAGLSAEQSALVMELLAGLPDRYQDTPAVQELKTIKTVLEACGFGDDRVVIDTSTIRGLDYYTGAVFEAQLTFPVQNEAGETVVFGSVAGGGRYDDLVARFTGQTVPATGVSIGVSRLISALTSRGLSGASQPLIVVTVMDKADAASSFKMVAELRAAGLRAEAYVGTQKFGDQMKYADRRGAAIAVIEGGDERAKGEVTLKDLALGAELAKSVESRAAWTANRQAQLSVKRDSLVAAIKDMLKKSVMAAFPYYDSTAIGALNDQAVLLLKLFGARGYTREEPAILQPAEIFLNRSGEEIRRRTFTLTDPSGRDLCLRPDLTIPICKHAVDAGAKFPARLSYNGLAFRYQPNRPLRPTQFFQAGVELLGVDNPAAGEEEILSLAFDALRQTGLGDFDMRFGDLALFGALVDALALPAQWQSRLKRHFWRAGYIETLLQRLGQGGGGQTTRADIEAQLAAAGDAPPAGRSRDDVIARAMDRAAEAASLHLDPVIAGIIPKLFAISGPAQQALDEIKLLLFTAGIKLDAPIAAMEARLKKIAALGVDLSRVRFTAHFGRNMEYYTGFVFELWSRDAEGPVQVAGGGRYDTLMETLGAHAPVSAIGCALRTERMLVARAFKGAA